MVPTSLKGCDEYKRDSGWPLSTVPGAEPAVYQQQVHTGIPGGSQPSVWHAYECVRHTQAGMGTEDVSRNKFSDGRNYFCTSAWLHQGRPHGEVIFD